MTAVAGLVVDGTVWMGADSAGTGEEDTSLHIRKDPKVVKIRFAGSERDEFLIGFGGSFRVCQIVRYHLMPEAPRESQDAFDYMVRTFVPALRKVLVDHEFDCDGKCEWEFLVGWRGSLFSVHEDYAVAEWADPFAATGCGMDAVLGSLYTTQKLRLGPKRRITMALEAAERFSAGVRGPFVIQSI